jgi:hypothetical protein
VKCIGEDNEKITQYKAIKRREKREKLTKLRWKR